MILIENIQGIKVFYSNELEGCGQNVNFDLLNAVRILLKFKNVENCLEWCSGPGFFGFMLLGSGVCKKLDLADIYPPVKAFVNYTIENNNLSKTVRFHLSDNFNNIPKNIKYDLIVANPPHFNLDPFVHFYDDPRKYKDTDWKVHEGFFDNVNDYLTPGGSIVLMENVWGSNPKTFAGMLEKNNLYVSEILRSQQFPNDFYYMCIKKKNDS